MLRRDYRAASGQQKAAPANRGGEVNSQDAVSLARANGARNPKADQVIATTARDFERRVSVATPPRDA